MSLHRNLGNVRVNNLHVKKFMLKYFRGKVNHENLANENLHYTVFVVAFTSSEKPVDSKLPVFMFIYLKECWEIAGYVRSQSQRSRPAIIREA